MKTHFVDPDPHLGAPGKINAPAASDSLRGMKTLSNFCPMSSASGKERWGGGEDRVSHMEPSEVTASCSFCLEWKTVSELETSVHSGAGI